MSKFKKGICIAAVIIIGIVIAGFVSSIIARDTKTIPASAFSVGTLDAETGKYKADEQTIYTKEMFECKGLRVEPDFEATCTYDVFYYDNDGRLLEKKLGLSEIYDEDFPLAQYARIVIHPDIEAELKEDETADEWCVGTLEVRRIAKMLKITVDKEQNNYYNYKNLYVEAEAQEGMTFDKNGAASETLVIEEDSNMKVSNQIAITGEYKYYDVYVKEGNFGAFAISAVCVSEDNTILLREVFNMADLEAGEWCKMTVKVPKTEEDIHLIVRLPVNSECYVFGYNK